MYRVSLAVLAGILMLFAAAGIGQAAQNSAQAAGAQPQSRSVPTAPRNWANTTTQQRADATRAFLGLGPPPDKAAATRGAPLFERNCAFCHGPEGRGAVGPNLITSDEVLDDQRGEHLVPFLKKGRPDRGMPSFATMSDQQLTDITEFLHQQVEDVANRGTYHLLNILVGNAASGKQYVQTHCLSCHTAESFAHFASRFRSPDALQRGWIWPARGSDPRLAVTATVTEPVGGVISGRVIQVSDFRITMVDGAGQTHVIDREAGTEVRLHDPLAPHQAMIKTLTNEEMHDITAYLDTLK